MNDKIDPKKAGFTTGKDDRIRLQPGQLRLQAGTLIDVSDDILALLLVAGELQKGKPQHEAFQHLDSGHDWVRLAFFNATKSLFDRDAPGLMGEGLASDVEGLMAVLTELAIVYRLAAHRLGCAALSHRRGAPAGARSRAGNTTPQRAREQQHTANELLEHAIREAQRHNPKAREIDVLRDRVKQAVLDSGKRTIGGEAEDAIEKRAQALHKKLRRARALGRTM